MYFPDREVRPLCHMATPLDIGPYMYLTSVAILCLCGVGDEADEDDGDQHPAAQASTWLPRFCTDLSIRALTRIVLPHEHSSHSPHCHIS